ncbi:MAG: inorganic phosphate transporter [Acidimicrobiales bacterium]|jgi:PiT family inorganic phosphate transporter
MLTNPLTTILLAVAVVFAVVKGLNDGASLVAVTSAGISLMPLAAVLTLGGALVVGPLLVGTRVATTFAIGLVPAHGASGRLSFLIGISAAMAVSAFLATRGLPTSLTMAIVGGLAGAGAGSGLPVAWSTVAIVVAVGLGAPLLAGIVASLVLSGLGRLPRGRSTQSRLRWLNYSSFGLQALAYSANDGQSMLAVFAVAVSGTSAVEAHLPELTVLAVAFCSGAVLGLGRVGRSLTRALVLTGPADGIAAELASTASAFAARAFGAPVSMTQTMTAGLAGARTRAGLRRVRWEQAARLMTAWAVTLPLSAFVGAAVAVSVGALR